VFRNNIAHSISGYGVIAANVKNDCTEVTDIVAYKVTEAAVMHGGPSRINRARRLVSVDTRYGIAVHASFGVAEVNDCVSFGEITDNADCPSGSPCDHCIDRTGLVLPLGNDDGHEDRQPKFTKLPLFKKSGSLTGRGEVHNHRFVDYDSPTTTCGSKQRAIMPFNNPNYTPYS